MVVNAGMQSMAIIESHVGSETSLQMIKVFEGSTSYPFGFQGMEERFHMGIVLAVVGPVHTDQEAMTLQSIDIRSAPVFHTSVRMKDTAGSGGTILQRLYEGSGGEPHGAISS